MRRRFVSAAAGALVVLAIMASTVSAHECFVVNRSAQGNAGASHSGEWFTLTLGQLFSETESFGLPDLTDSQVDWAVARALEAGVPASFTIRTDKLIGENAGGIHQEWPRQRRQGHRPLHRVYGNTLIGIVFEASRPLIEPDRGPGVRFGRPGPVREPFTRARRPSHVRLVD